MMLSAPERGATHSLTLQTSYSTSSRAQSPGMNLSGNLRPRRGCLLSVLSCVAYRPRSTYITTQDESEFPTSPYAGNRVCRNIPSQLGFDSCGALRNSKKRRAGLDLQ